jgi:hypothetical protein
MQRFARLDVPGDGVGQRLQKGRALAHPIGQGRAVQLDAGTGVDRALSMEGRVVDIFCHQHMRQQRRAGAAALDRQALQGLLALSLSEIGSIAY